jgi:formylglycine-generating enzyme required for sulfatase activity
MTRVSIRLILSLVILVAGACSPAGRSSSNPLQVAERTDADGDGANALVDCDDTDPDVQTPEEGCAPGGACQQDAGCESGVCDQSTQTCAAATCDDGVANGDESAQDCGGICDPCAEGAACTQHSDCASERCLSNTSDGESSQACAGLCENARVTGPDCDLCHPRFAGDNCDACANHWSGDNCDVCAPQFAGNNCDICAPEFAGDTCDACANHWSGDNCDVCAPQFAGNNCDICAPEFAGDDCDVCAPQFTGDNCDDCANQWSGDNCDVCPPQFGGDNCDVCADPRFAAADCMSCAPHHYGADCTPAPCVATGGCPELDFVAITGGEFQMGSNDGDAHERPTHAVNIANFELLRNEVTVAQYRACVDAGACSPARTGLNFNWVANAPSLQNHPINGVSWNNAVQFCLWIGARLPSEAEWEYAARSQGQNQTYPWGDAAPDCERVNIDGCAGSDRRRTSRVCVHQAGHSAQGVCDLGGNVAEWVEDDYHNSYTGAPNDGFALIDNPRGSDRIYRGGAWSSDPWLVRAANRGGYIAGGREPFLGFRAARSTP